MPRPQYIVCSESGTEDKVTGLLSLFNVIDQVTVTRLPAEEVQKGLAFPIPLPMRVTAVWRREKGEEPREFEYQLIFRFESQTKEPKEDIVSEGTFRFTKELQRLSLQLPVGVSFGSSGLFRVTNRIRPVGTQEWLSQDYPISVVLAEEKHNATPSK